MSSSHEATAWIEGITHRLDSIIEWSQRAIIFGNSIASVSPEEASIAFSKILISAFRLRDSGSTTTAQSAMLSILRGTWSESHRTHTREAAAAEGDTVTLNFLVQPSVPDFDEDDYAVPDYGSARPMTLGERRTIASRPSRRTIEHAMQDPHPMVAIKLLDNPKLTEDDVVRISARRPMAPATLVEIATHAKWRFRSRVAFALALNHCLPPPFAVTLLPTLSASLVREIASDGRLHEDTTAAAETLLAAH